MITMRKTINPLRSFLNHLTKGKLSICSSDTLNTHHDIIYRIHKIIDENLMHWKKFSCVALHLYLDWIETKYNLFSLFIYFKKLKNLFYPILKFEGHICTLRIHLFWSILKKLNDLFGLFNKWTACLDQKKVLRVYFTIRHR